MENFFYLIIEDQKKYSDQKQGRVFWQVILQHE